MKSISTQTTIYCYRKALIQNNGKSINRLSCLKLFWSLDSIVPYYHHTDAYAHTSTTSIFFSLKAVININWSSIDSGHEAKKVSSNNRLVQTTDAIYDLSSFEDNPCKWSHLFIFHVTKLRVGRSLVRRTEGGPVSSWCRICTHTHTLKGNQTVIYVNVCIECVPVFRVLRRISNGPGPGRAQHQYCSRSFCKALKYAYIMQNLWQGRL